MKKRESPRWLNLALSLAVAPTILSIDSIYKNLTRADTAPTPISNPIPQRTQETTQPITLEEIQDFADKTWEKICPSLKKVGNYIMNYFPITTNSIPEQATTNSLQETQTSELEKKLIVLDPGHRNNENDFGAPYVNFNESEIVMDQAKRVREILQKKGYKVLLTRESEEDTRSLGSRVPFANSNGAVAYVSLHCNADSDSHTRGIETYHLSGEEDSNRLATLIQSSLVQEIPSTRDRGIKTGDYRVLKGDNDFPQVLVESGFGTNPEDLKYLIEHPDTVAKAIAKGIDNYFKGK